MTLRPPARPAKSGVGRRRNQLRSRREVANRFSPSLGSKVVAPSLLRHTTYRRLNAAMSRLAVEVIVAIQA